MRIVFWQNCLSPHQLPYIVHLLDDERVDEIVVVADETVSGARKDMGWSVAQYDGLDRCKVYVHPHDKIIESLFDERPEDSHHLFSGIRMNRFVFKCLQISLAYHVKRGIITERPNTYDFKHNIPNAKPYWLHRLRFWIQDRKYAKQIQTVFAIGNEAVKYFQSLGIDWNVFPFYYCTQHSDSVDSKPVQDSVLPQYLFCGSLSYRKYPNLIVKGFSQVDASSYGGVKFIGDGPLFQSLDKEIKENNLEEKMHLLGTKSQTEVPLFMQRADIFILPTIYDGWGAVVNEALQTGCYVICSDAAGASDLLLQDDRLGKIFHTNDVKQFVDCVKWCNEHIQEIRRNRKFRLNWAESHISGKAIARYMIDCLEKSLNA